MSNTRRPSRPETAAPCCVVCGVPRPKVGGYAADLNADPIAVGIVCFACALRATDRQEHNR